MIKGADFSPCRKYRFTLFRIFDEARYKKEGACTFICLNPSTADETIDDPTVRRCINYAKDLGYAAFIMLNIFAYRATDPADMKAIYDPVGLCGDAEYDNNYWIESICKRSAIVVAAWGNHGSHMNRAEEVELLLGYHNIDLYCLKINSSTRMPSHPLYLKKTLKPKLLKDMRLRP